MRCYLVLGLMMWIISWIFFGLSLLVGRQDAVGLPEGGIVQLLHLYCPSWGTVMLPIDHHWDSQTVGSIAGKCSNNPNFNSLASWNGTVAWGGAWCWWCMADQEVHEIGDVLRGDIGWQLLRVRGSRCGWAAKWGWSGYVGDSQGMECLACIFKERDFYNFEAAW